MAIPISAITGEGQDSKYAVIYEGGKFRSISNPRRDYDYFGNTTYHTKSCTNGVCTETQRFKNGSVTETTYIDPDYKPSD